MEFVRLKYLFEIFTSNNFTIKWQYANVFLEFLLRHRRAFVLENLGMTFPPLDITAIGPRVSLRIAISENILHRFKMRLELSEIVSNAPRQFAPFHK